MAPTVLRAGNLRFVIYLRDHEPPHIHVYGPRAEAKFVLAGQECIYSRGFSAKAVREIASFLRGKEESLLEVWREYQE